MNVVELFYLENKDWIEDFYENFEKISGESRPVDYKERAHKVLTGKRNTVLNQKEGRASHEN